MMDWTLCVICQKATEEKLNSPLSSNHSGHDTVYKDFLDRARRFKLLDALPIEFDVDNSDHAVWKENGAAWHQSCRRAFTSYMLQRVENSKTKSRKRKLTRSATVAFEKAKCVFCQDDIEKDLHKCAKLDDKMNRMAHALEDDRLIGILEQGDVVALDIKYHRDCLTSYERAYFRKVTPGPTEFSAGKVATEELLSKIEDDIASGVTVFSMRQLLHDYQTILGDTSSINSTRLKNDILARFPDFQEQQGSRRGVYLIASTEKRKIVSDAITDTEGHAKTLVKAAMICRRAISKTARFKFDGSFCDNQEIVPPALAHLVRLLLYGYQPDGDRNISRQEKTISELLIFNMENLSSRGRHETPLPLYIGIWLHSQTRSKKLIKHMSELGVSVSFDRVMAVEQRLAETVAQQARVDGLVCPQNLRNQLFTVGALDNLDHNPTSRTSKSSFHGTGISLFQQPSVTNGGTPRDPSAYSDGDENRSQLLPDSYTVVAPLTRSVVTSVPPSRDQTGSQPEHIAVSHPEADAGSYHAEPIADEYHEPIADDYPEPIVDENPEHAEPIADENPEGITREELEEKAWMKHVRHLLRDGTDAESDLKAMWSSYHASRALEMPMSSPSIGSILPFFYESSSDPRMVKHGMEVVRQVVHFLNPGQIPVLAVDQPLYAIAKKLQWTFPDEFGEPKFVVLMGGLHIEMALWHTLGDILRDSGWAEIVAASGIATPGTAASFLTAADPMKTRYAHQVTVAALDIILQDAYSSSDTNLSVAEWMLSNAETNPTFAFWLLIMKYQQLVLLFVRAHRQHNFRLFVETLKALVGMFFSMDHQNYARWLPVFIADLESLPPTVLADFEDNGSWTISRTMNRFSAIAIDQAHEQNNKLVKGVGGIIGLTEDPASMAKWVLIAPTLARLVDEFQENHHDSELRPHHEEGKASQLRFLMHLQNMSDSVLQAGNPFQEGETELVSLHGRVCLSASSSEAVQQIDTLGRSRYEDYKTSVLENQTRDITTPIKKNKLAFFKQVKQRKTTTQKKLSHFKDQASLYGQLFVSLHVKETYHTSLNTSLQSRLLP